MGKQAKAADGVVPTEPNPARVYDYFLGGRDNYRVDRDVAERVIAEMPEVAEGARATRAVLGRVVRYLVRDAGIRQFLDIGAGLPTRENVHQIAQRADPAVRVVYVDNDPVVLAYARALLADNPATVVADGDLRDPARIIAHPIVRGHLDWTRPIGLLLGGVLPEILDHERPEAITATLIDALPSGSYVFIQHLLIMDDPKMDDPGQPGSRSSWPGRSAAFSSGLLIRCAGSSTTWISSTPVWCRPPTGDPIRWPTALTPR